MIKKRIIIVAIFVLILIICFAASQLSRINERRNATDDKYSELFGDETTVTEAEETTAEDEPYVSPLYEIYEKNNDFVGKLTVEGTNIDYPVMQTAGDPEYYLRRDFYKEDDVHGVPFADAKCKIGECDNLIIYGHNMYDGTMFAELEKFTDAEFSKNGIIRFETLDGVSEYKVISVFTIGEDEIDMFPYHTMTYFDNPYYRPDDYVGQANYYAIWNDGDSVEDDAKLLTLSTCEYSHYNGRLVVIAKKIG